MGSSSLQGDASEPGHLHADERQAENAPRAREFAYYRRMPEGAAPSSSASFSGSTAITGITARESSSSCS